MASSLKKSNSQTSNAIYENRIIDLVFLCAQTMGDPKLEVEILKLFDQTASSSLKIILSDNVDNEKALKLHLHSLKGAAAGVGAKAIVKNIMLAEEDLRQNGYVEAQMLANIGFAVEEARRFIARIIAD
ncbi:MAG: hypothetical protein L3J15_00500 [Devosiaceae bacterium]|nr:hypothetical protein [Devosiaceae bacterium]